MLAPGAASLPLAHLSVRVPWHDLDWTGRVCAAPAANHACAVLKNIKGKKDADSEETDREKPWAELERSNIPPCIFERGGFMRPTAFQVERDHAYAGGWTKSHAHFAPTIHRMPAYSFEATPYRWVMREEAQRYAAEWGIGYDQALEDAADAVIENKKATNWVQDHRNQLALLDSFFSGVKPGKSLALVYAKDVALLDERPPGTRVLIGAGLVTDVSPVVEWEYSTSGPLRSIMWERSVGHSIRPTNADGFLLPYHALVRDPELQGESLLPFLAFAPGEHFDEFSYVTERVGHDGAIAALLELARVVDLLPGVTDGPWDVAAMWLSDRIADAWALRGPFPGLGAALTAAGMERGGLIAHRVVDSLASPSDDPWPALHEAIAAAESGQGAVANLVGRMARKAWDLVAADSERLALLRLLARFPLTTTQARRIFDPDLRAEHAERTSDAELIANPYVIYELDRGRGDAISFSTIDRGLFPRDAGANAALSQYPLPEPVTESADDRRVRAACVSVLETAAGEGHALLDEPQLRKRLSTLKVDPVCDPSNELFVLAAGDFDPTLIETPLAREGRGWQLARLASAAEIIESEIETRLAAGPIDVAWPWRQRIDEVVPEAIKPGDHEEEAAREEKARALEVLARSRVAALVGPAGTGKTTMLAALCSHPEVQHAGVLLLAPTGKARVQLGDKVGAKARTLAQHLRPSGRWHNEIGYRVSPSAKKESGFATVIVDEASMLTEEMLAALFDSLLGVERFVLCGDHRQLPAIGAGRPFADVITHLQGLDADEAGGVAELTIGRRQKTGPGASASARDDLAVASMFSVDGVSPASDEALGRVLSGNGDETITVVRWDSEEELHERVVAFLEGELGITPGDADALKRSLGAAEKYKEWASFGRGDGAAGAELWQLLSPVRSRSAGVDGLNQLVRRTWRKGDASLAMRSWKIPPPLGADEILFHDKVMCGVNHQREGDDGQTHAKTKTKYEVSNGEIGMAVSWWKNKCVRVEFSTQPDRQFTFWTDELNKDSERSSELLELAYAITVHKAQGSQFGTTLVVIPNPCPLLSPELLYTALTRQRDRVVLFVQGDPNGLRQLGSPSRSETARRLTRLFHAPDPFQTPEGAVVDGSHVHRTLNDELVRSKSEVIVANTLHGLGIEYVYEQDLVMADGSHRSPDFTIARLGKPTVYWEHLGMLDNYGYKADWEAKQQWYASHGILPLDDGGGPGGSLVCSSETRKDGIDSLAIEALAREVLAHIA